MKWLVSLVVGVLTAVLGMIVAGVVAGLAVDWYHVSSFEGASGYLVIFIALLGGIAGLIIGVIASRVVAARPRPGFWKAVGTAFAIVIVIGSTTGVVLRLLADVPPTIDGEELFVRVELRWADGAEPSPEMRAGEGTVSLGATSGSTIRASEEGPLFIERTARVDGRWVTPGAVKVFTSRGGRVLFFRFGETALAGFDLALPRWPRNSNRSWSEWLPKNYNPSVNGGFSYRFQIQLANEPFRTEAVGPFEVETRVSSLHHVFDSERFAAESEFSVRYRGAPLPGLDRANAVAVIGGPAPALLVNVSEVDRGPICHLVYERNGQFSDTSIGPCTSPIVASPLTNDQAVFDASREHPPLRGWIDRDTLAQPGRFLVTQTVLDTRELTAHPFLYSSDYSPNLSVPPLAVSPDGLSFVALGYDRAVDGPGLFVINQLTNTSYAVPIERARMRFNNDKDFGPDWIDHHFTWQASADGPHLSARPDFVPLPYRGELTLGPAGDYQSYTLRPGGQALREALVRMLVEQLHAERLPDELGGYQQRVRLEGKELNVTVGDSPAYVNLSMDGAAGDPVLIAGLARTLDAWLADGRQDHLFVADPPATR
jgi:hypothetical protein